MDEAWLLDQLSWLLIYSGLTIAITFPLFGLSAQYGRFANDAFKWAPRYPAKIMWFIQETPSFLIPLVMLWRTPVVDSKTYISVSLLVVHYINRAIIFPLKMRNPPPYAFYIAILAFTFSTWNGLLQSRYLLYHSTDFTMNALKMAGLLISIAGLFANAYFDYTLTALRRPTDTDYKIPYGSLFEYVSCPNFLAECVEWAGFALFTQSFPAMAFATFTFLNLATMASQHHRFYINKFEDYPQNRKRMIPFIY